MGIEQAASTIRDCRFCWMCRHICPVSNVTGNESHTPRGKALVLWTVLKGMTDLENEEVIDILYKCALCESCKNACVTDRDVPKMIKTARESLAQQDRVPAKGKELKNNIVNTGNPWDIKEVPELLRRELEKIPSTGQILLYLGCRAKYQSPEIGYSAIRLLQAAGISFSVLDKDDACCGTPLENLGYKEQAKSKALKVVERIKQSGCNTVITICPRCLDALSNTYQEMGIVLPENVNLLHTSDFILDLVKQKKLLFKQSHETVTIHDPCILARKHKQSIQVTRDLLSNIPGLNLKEMQMTGKDTNCCGGSILHKLDPELGSNIAQKRVEEARVTGASKVITTCPTCRDTLGKTEIIKVYELNEYLYENVFK